MSTNLTSALIVVDVQNGFINKRTASLPRKIATLIAKRKFDVIVFTKFVNKKGSNYFRSLNWQKMLHSPAIDIHPALESVAVRNTIFQKSTYSAFGAAGLQRHLRKKGVSRLYLCGIDIDACVLATAFNAFDRGYQVEVLQEYCKSQAGKKCEQATKIILERNIQST